jgi:PAS domain S-box-containing protein
VEALQAREELLKSIFRASPIGIGVVCDRVIQQVNDRLCEMVGYSRDELLEQSARILYPTDEAFEYVGREKYAQIRDLGIGTVETRLRRKDGKVIDVLLSSAPIHPEDLSTGVTFTVLDISDRKRAEEALRRSNEELLKEHNQRIMLSKSLIELLEKDRRQTAMELHDHIGQTLTSLKMNLEMIHGKLKPDHTELGAQITNAQERTIQAINDVKNVSYGLRPAMIDTLGVVSSLRELFNEVQQQTDMEIHFFNRGIPERFEEGKELAIYRIAQEALNNIIRHARAKHVFVNLVKKDEKLSLSVEDDGVGFDQDKEMNPSRRKGPLGLLIMRERAVQFDGEFTIESQIGKGTHLLVEIPI